MPADTIRRIAAELAACRLRAADRARYSVDGSSRPLPREDGRPPGVACTPCAASRPMPTASRPAARCTCCRSCSAPSMCPGGFRYKPPFPKPVPPGVKPAGKPGQVKPNTPLARPAARLRRRRPTICWSMRTARPQRIDKAYSWDAPLAAHGMMHMVITNAGEGRPLRHRHAVHVHGQHELELGHERAGHA